LRGLGLEFVRNDGDRLETPASAWPDIESSHAYMFTLDSTEIGGIIRHDWDSGFRGPNFRINEQDNSNIRFQYGDGENRIRVYTNDDPFDENKKIRFAFVMRGDSGSADDMEIWANGVQSDLTTHDGGSVSGMPDWEGPVPIGGNYDQGSRSGMYDGIIDNWINFYEAPAKSEIQDDYNNQPWS